MGSDSSLQGLWPLPIEENKAVAGRRQWEMKTVNGLRIHSGT